MKPMGSKGARLPAMKKKDEKINTPQPANWHRVSNDFLDMLRYSPCTSIFPSAWGPPVVISISKPEHFKSARQGSLIHLLFPVFFHPIIKKISETNTPLH